MRGRKGVANRGELKLTKVSTRATLLHGRDKNAGMVPNIVLSLEDEMSPATVMDTKRRRWHERKHVWRAKRRIMFVAWELGTGTEKSS